MITEVLASAKERFYPAKAAGQASELGGEGKGVSCVGAGQARQIIDDQCLVVVGASTG